jgi:hypothetical protein
MIASITNKMTLSDNKETHEYLEIVKAKQDEVIQQMDTLVVEYGKCEKIYKANALLIKSLEELLGLSKTKKDKLKEQERTLKEREIVNFEYNDKATVAEKAAYVLNKKREPLTVNQILEVLYEFDNTLSRKEHQKNASKFAATLSQKVTQNQMFFRKPVDNGNVLWGLLIWTRNLNTIIKDKA